MIDIFVRTVYWLKTGHLAHRLQKSSANKNVQLSTLTIKTTNEAYWP